MKKVILIAGMILATIVPVFASGYLAPKPPIQDVLIADKAGWTGLKYNGLPINGGSDAIGTNINYLAQIIIYGNEDGSSSVQIMARGFAPSAYSGGLTEISDNTFIGINTVTFQDSGIVMPKSLYSGKDNADRTSNQSWQITTIYRLDAAKTTSFKNQLDSWIVGKNFHTPSTGGLNSYYYKK